MNFDKLMCENTNIPTVDKSSGTVGKLGVTSSTLTRTNLVSGNYIVFINLLFFINYNNKTFKLNSLFLFFCRKT